MSYEFYKVKREENEFTAYQPSTSSEPAASPIIISHVHLNLPATTAGEFKLLERYINEDFTKECSFVNELRETDATTLGKYIRKCLRKMITDEAARKFSWRANKKEIKNFPVSTYTVLEILKIEAINKFPNAASVDVEAISRKWFQCAKDRCNKRNRYHRLKFGKS